MNFDMACVNHQPFVIRILDKNFQYSFPDTVPAPSDEPLMDRARQDAVRKARARADLYAAAAGLSVRRITAISEGFTQRPPVPMPRMVAMDSVAAAPPPPVAPGEVGLSASVTMEFELGPR